MKDYFDPKSNMMVSGKIAYEEAAKKPTVVIEEYVNVDETFQNIKNIKVGSMTLNDLFGDNLKVIENALEERKKLLKWKDSQQELIKGKDEYIAKLCCDRAELKEHEKELIAEQHRLFDLAKEQETKFNKLEKFARVMSQSVEVNEFGSTDAYYNTANVITKDTIVDEDVTLVKEVLEEYGKKED